MANVTPSLPIPIASRYFCPTCDRVFAARDERDQHDCFRECLDTEQRLAILAARRTRKTTTSAHGEVKR